MLAEGDVTANSISGKKEKDQTMRITRYTAALAAAAGLLFSASAAHATFHLMQIEQVIGGVNGDASAQAIQLRQRFPGQNLVAQSRVMAYDAAGLNPVLIVDMTTNVANPGSGTRILIASASFATDPAVTPDFVMTNTIPASYLAAGSLTFESDSGDVLWRICWGGKGYTGPTTIAEDNDAEEDGTIAPILIDALPSSSLQALLFNGTAIAGATNNAAQYAVTAGAATFVSNGGQSGTVVGAPQPCEGDVDDNGSVDVDDLVGVILGWGTCPVPPPPCAADVAPPEGNGVVDVDDLVVVILNWGPCK
jgi:hypothetical protein